MGQSTNGQICYGIPFEEDFEFPWIGEESEGAIEDWWIYQVKGFTHSKECYDEDGEELPGITDADTDAYFKEKRDFEKAHPIPIELVNYCSGDCAMYAIAVPSSILSARRGYPKEFDPNSLRVSPEEHAALVKFCSDHGIEVPSEPKWLLSSYWG